MSTRSVIVRLEAEVSKYVAGMGAAGSATDSVARQVVNTRKNVKENAAAMDQAGGALLKAGTITVASLGASAKAAMDWETAWAGVTKTVDGTPAQMNQLEKSLRDLTKVLPASHEEIAGVAEAAGQLGVKRADIVGFTKTMIDLGESTNLTADEAATNIAQISNVMGTMEREGSAGVARFGSALVALGNDGASTEKEILDMAQRISGAAATIGASETDVLALSNTLASMGVKAEMGGGVVTRVMLKMYDAVQEGGEGLSAFAKTAGVSADVFSEKFKTSPVEALDMVNKGLFKVKEEGGNVVSTLADLGIKGTQETQVMLAMASSGDLLSDSLALGAKAWAENTALTKEAGKRYDTTASKVKIAWNKIKDAAIDGGAVMLPIIQGIAESVGGLATAFGDLPAPVQGTITILAGVLGVAALVTGGFLTLIPKIAATRDAFSTMHKTGSKVPAMLGKITKAAGLAAAAYAAMAAASALVTANSQSDETKTSVEGFSNALSGVSKNGAGAKKALDGVFDGVLKVGNSDFTAVNDLEGAISRIFHAKPNDNANDFFLTLMGQNAATGINRSKDALLDMDKALAAMTSSGNQKDAAAGFKLVADEARRQGKDVTDLLPLFPSYADAVRSSATANGDTQLTQEGLTRAMLDSSGAASGSAVSQQVLADRIGETGVNIDAVVEDMEKFLELLFQTGMLTMSARDAQAAYAGALRGIDEALKTVNDSAGAMGNMLNKNKTDFDLNTEAGATANAAFQDLARKGMADVEAASKAGAGQDELQAKLTKTKQDLEAAAAKLGITGQAAKDLARDVLGVPDGVSVESWMSDRAKKMAQETKTAIDLIPKNTEITIMTRQTSVFSELHTANGRGGTGGQQKATGGAIYGPGTGTSDDVPIMASNGEHMFTTEEVQKMGGQNEVYRFRAAIRRGEGIAHHASGGEIGRSVSSRSLVNSSGQPIDYDRLAGAFGGTGATYQFVVPDRATAAEYFDEARYQTRVQSRGGGTRR